MRCLLAVEKWEECDIIVYREEYRAQKNFREETGKVQCEKREKNWGAIMELFEASLL